MHPLGEADCQIDQEELHLEMIDESIPQQPIIASGDNMYDWETELKRHRDNNADVSKEFEQLAEEVKLSNELMIGEEELSEEDRLAYEKAKAQWDNVQLLREQQHYGKESVQISEVDGREVNITYDETLKYFKSLNLEKECESANEQLNTRGEGRNLFQKLFSCFGTDSEDIQNEKVFLLALTNIQLNHEIEEHERILFTIYKKITGDKQNCPSIGPHWEAIGFQRTDPKTDLRGVGMLGLTQLLFFVYSDERTLRDIYLLSHTQNFPLAVVSLNMTQLVLKMMLDGKLSRIISKYECPKDACLYH
nr:unnamed protein product [Naegleria fowleri]